jgi:hypothetical protein
MRNWILPACLVALCPVISSAQEPEMPKPGPEHALLAKDVGVWDADVKMFMDPTAPPQESKAVETNTMFGDFFLKSEFKGDFGGMPFTGTGINGYDPFKKKYVGTWCDTFSPTMMLMEGTYDEKSGELTMTADTVDMTGKPAKAKMVTKHNPDGTRHFTMYMKSEATGPDWVKNMEVTYTRRK